MAAISGHWAFAFGVLGNIVSFIVFLSSLPTFYKIYKKKSTEGYQSIPYMVQTVKMLVLFVVADFGVIVLVTQFLFKGAARGQAVGWICLVFSLCVFVAPLGIVRQVIKTKSVKYMPLLLSVFLTLSAVMWFFYGLLVKDINIAIPNILGFILGIFQMVLYIIYNKKEKAILKEQKLPEKIQNHVIIVDENNNQKLPELTEEQIIDIVKLGSLISSGKIHVASCLHNSICGVEAAKVENMPKLQTAEP
ncbi:PREDICTED: bidirectional sugar transporter SWEET12-like isoform X2 [Nicotiana attenuata]|uniref:bidirectional sugar transporter SWEET12-like isoform X2 n=1 Tax=Nicotiana attenuata TaxID=49451 RepID=UPI000904D9F5|nr:PREDICTED: bidirectional sugar transporter SWEET12-like isoform X2 [Nicotiana attenuata]